MTNKIENQNIHLFYYFINFDNSIEIKAPVLALFFIKATS